MRITEKTLQLRIDRLNELTGNPIKTYSRINERKSCSTNIGNFHLDFAYGGVALVQVTNKQGGVTAILSRSTKRELLGKLDAYIAGIEFKFKR